MIPIIVDPQHVEIALVGGGECMHRRLGWLRDGGAVRLTVYSTEAIATDAVPRIARVPTAAELAAFHIVWIVGLPQDLAERLARGVRRLGRLVNVEDTLPLCDFHTPAIVRRGDLLVAISTAGKSPGLAMRLRAWIEGQLGQEWAERLETIARKRRAWRRKPRRLDELAALTDAVIDHRGWLEPVDRRTAAHHAPSAH